ncbi:MAG: MoaD/ThiS family protein [Candidatus Nitrosopolaris sp.]
MKSSRINNQAISTIKVSVIYFAQIRELTGIREEEVIIEKESTLTNLISKIEENHPSLLKVKENIQFAVNCNLVCKNLSLKEGDQIEVFPPVAGG